MQRGLPLSRLPSLQRSAEQTEWHHEQKERDYCGQYCHLQTLPRPPVLHTPGLQVRQLILYRDKDIVKRSDFA